MSSVSVCRQELSLDGDGLLIDPSSWNESVAHKIADQFGVGELSKEHWYVIYALRQYHEKYGVAPEMNSICRPQGKDWRWVHNLFHTCLNAWRVAGLPNPGEEAKAYMSDM